MKIILLAITSVLFFLNSNNLDARSIPLTKGSSKFSTYFNIKYDARMGGTELPRTMVYKNKGIYAYLFVAIVKNGKWEVFYKGFVDDGEVGTDSGGIQDRWTVYYKNPTKLALAGYHNLPALLPQKDRDKYPGYRVYAYLWSYENGRWSLPTLADNDIFLYTKEALDYFYKRTREERPWEFN